MRRQGNWCAFKTCLAHGVAFTFEARGERSVVVRLLAGELLLGLLRLLGLLLLLLRLRGLSALAAGGSTGQGARGRANGSPLARIAGDGTNGRTGRGTADSAPSRRCRGGVRRGLLSTLLWRRGSRWRCRGIEARIALRPVEAGGLILLLLRAVLTLARKDVHAEALRHEL